MASHAERTDRTRRALLDAARPLFEARGFQAVAAEELVAAAGVTRGALYHHFEGKEGLFEAVVDQVMGELHRRMAAAARDAPDPLAALKVAMDAFLRAAAAPRAQRVLFVDGPAVLGWARWRQLDDRYGLGSLKKVLGAAAAAGQLRVGDTDLAAHLLVAAMIEAAMLVARSHRKTATREAAAQLLRELVHGWV